MIDRISEYFQVFPNRISRSALLLTAAALLTAPVPVLAKSKKEQQPEVVQVDPVLLTGFSQVPAVQAYYARYSGPKWFKDGGVAAAELSRILRRSKLDGLSQADFLADKVASAAQWANSSDKRERAAADQILSAAWVTYVEAINRPTSDMIYGYSSLAPQPVRVDQVLSAAAAAPSLAEYLQQEAEVNPIYADLREAAWTQMSAAPGMAPDPRIVKNLERLRSLPKTERFALVNIVTQTLTMYENGKPVDSMKVIVGQKELPTPMISSVIYYATFNPYWNVPDHLVRKIVAKGVQKGGMEYLKVRGYEVMSSWAADATPVPASSVDWAAVADGRIKIRVRQQPSAYNSMGNLKFSFENGEGIFMHDTPSKNLFAKSERTLSNGCVRLEDARRFGRWLLNREPAAPSSSPEQFVPLPTGVPVYISYLTAQENNGKIAFLNDVYGWDAGGSFKPLGPSASTAR